LTPTHHKLKKKKAQKCLPHKGKPSNEKLKGNPHPTSLNTSKMQVSNTTKICEQPNDGVL
jgi:hypothetical protein